ncbi:DoxX family protein [Rubripirellula amarantea]|nr:DoxX family protein [Rubripirellula amarantea]
MTAMVMLVLLRLTIGWHFFSEGVDKRDAGNWSAAPFFANAQGPYANHYRNLVWDADGQYRLNKEAIKYTFALYRDQVSQHYGFTDEQKAKANLNYIEAVKQYDWIVSENAGDLEEFELGRQRIAKLDNDSGERSLRDGVDSLGGQRETIRREWLGKAKPTFDQIETLWKNYEGDQQALATDDQLAANSSIEMIKPRTGEIDTSVIDRIVPYFDMAVGLCLLIGFMTPLASLAAAGFLASVFLSQYPPTTGPGSSNYQLIECMACLVLASTGAGRFAGLDYFLHLFVRRSEAEVDRDDE